MSLFKNMELKAYDLDTRIDNIIKNIQKKYLEKKKSEVDKNIDFETLKNIIEVIAEWHISRFYLTSIMYYNSDLLEIVDEKQEFLLDKFNMSDLMEQINLGLTKEQQNLFIYNDQFKRQIMRASLLQIIKEGGAYEGSEYGLIFAKAFNFDYAIPMLYASYDSSMTNPRLKKFIDKYLELGGPKNTYWLPNYFKNDKQKYVLEELKDVTYVIDVNKENSKTKENGGYQKTYN